METLATILPKDLSVEYLKRVELEEHTLNRLPRFRGAEHDAEIQRYSSNDKDIVEYVEGCLNL